MTVVQPEAPPPHRVRAERLAAMVASRICHDLVSPLGAIANGVELMELIGQRTPEGDLVAESVAAANARLRFFRVAYGLSEPDQRIGRAEITSTLAAVSRGGRLAFDWEVPEDLPRPEARAAFLLLQCLEAAMPFGGHVGVRRDGAALVATAEGTRLRIDDALWAGLRTGHGPGPDAPALVQFDLLPDLLAGLGRPIALTLGPDRIVARF